MNIRLAVARLALAMIAVGLGGCGTFLPSRGRIEHGVAIRQCTPVPVVGVEDLALDREKGVAFLASLDRWAVEDDLKVRGRIYRVDLKSSVFTPVELELGFPEQAVFHPLGVSFFRTTNGDERLFVVNRRQQWDARHGKWKNTAGLATIEIFEIFDAGLRLIRTISDAEALVSPNDIYALGAAQFYVTNDHGAKTGFSRFLEELFRLSRSKVYYFDGERFTAVAEKIAMANGITADLDIATLYLAATQEGRIHVYDLDRENPDRRLRLRHKISLGTAVDNLELDADGNLLLAAHPKPFAVYRYINRLFGTTTAPSQVIRVSLENGELVGAREIFRDDGTLLSAASVAATYGSGANAKILIGAIFSGHFLVCRL